MDVVANLIGQGKLEAAEQRLRERQSEAETNADWQWNYGRLKEAQGDRDAALAAFRKAIAIDPQHAEATFRLAYLLDLYGDEEQAVELYESLLSRTPVPVNVLLNLAVIYEDQGQYQDALHCVQRVLHEHPNHTRALLFEKDIVSSLNMFYDENLERTRQKRNALLDTPIGEFELSVRSRNCLKKMNINTLGDLLTYSEADLLSYKNFGETSLQEIKTMLAQKGLRLGQLKEERSAALRTVTRRPAVDAPPEVLNKPLSEIPFSSRARKCLERLNLLTIGDLMNKTEQDLLAIKNFGQTSLQEVRKKLAEYGLVMRKSN